MADNGVIVVGGGTIGYSERNIYVYWDISADLSSDRSFLIETPYYVVANSRYIAHQHIQYIYNTRWMHIEYEPIPVTDRTIYVHYSKCFTSERSLYYHPDTHERMIYVEGLMTNTPLLMKYPKYFNWSYVPQVVNPEFIIWSFYDLDYSNVVLKLTSTNGVLLTLNSGTAPEKFDIQELSNNQYKITIFVDYVFDANDIITCYITAYDIKGNYLKQGMW